MHHFCIINLLMKAAGKDIQKLFLELLNLLKSPFWMQIHFYYIFWNHLFGSESESQKYLAWQLLAQTAALQVNAAEFHHQSQPHGPKQCLHTIFGIHHHSLNLLMTRIFPFSSSCSLHFHKGNDSHGSSMWLSKKRVGGQILGLQISGCSKQDGRTLAPSTFSNSRNKPGCTQLWTEHTLHPLPWVFHDSYEKQLVALESFQSQLKQWHQFGIDWWTNSCTALLGVVIKTRKYDIFTQYSLTNICFFRFHIGAGYCPSIMNWTALTISKTDEWYARLGAMSTMKYSIMGYILIMVRVFQIDISNRNA